MKGFIVRALKHGCFVLLFLVIVGGSLHKVHGQAAWKAVVASDVLPVHSATSSTSPVVKSLHKGDAVLIDIELQTAQGTWCSVREPAETQKAGFVLCSALKRKQLRAAPLLAAPAARGDHGTIARSRPDTRIYFVPLGKLTWLSAADLVAYYKTKYNLTIDVLPELALHGTVVDARRQQLIAERLIALMKREYPRLASDPKAFLIGLTEGDMYIQADDWQFAFALRKGPRFAVVSAARMNPVSFGLPADANLLHTRARKMITREIGVLYYNLPLNHNPKSVLYRSILGLDELDGVGEEF